MIDIVYQYENLILGKENGDHLIIDDLSGSILVTIHSSQWSCTPKEKEKICKRLLITMGCD